MNINQKLQEARIYIKNTPLKKEGFNKHSKYPYFTPEQITDLVHEVCVEFNMLTKFDLIRNDLGLYGQLKIIDMEAKDSEVNFIMATEMPTITATNASQQMGGCKTFTQRYLEQTAFNITDNNLDPDSQDNRPKGLEKNLEVLSEALKGIPVQPPNVVDTAREETEGIINRLALCTTESELTDLWNTLDKQDQGFYQELFTNQKQLINE